MSYTLELTEPAREDLRRLDVWLQEEVLDELDKYALNPSLKKRRVGDVVHDFLRTQSTDAYYIFITMREDAKAKCLRVKSIALFVRRGG